MRPHPLEYNLILLQLINEQPVRFNVTFSATRIISDKLMVAMERIEPLTLNQRQGNDLELV